MPTLSTIGAACARAWGFTSGLVKDQYFNLVSLLLPGNGTNGANNNAFLDSSGQNGGAGWPITRNPTSGPNAPTQGTFSPFSQTGWSNYYNGSGYFSSSTALFAYTTGNASTQTFTIEAMVYHTARTTPVFQPYSQCIAGKGNVYMNFGINGTGNLIFLHNDGTERIITSSSTVPLNTWTYVAIVVSGGTATMYIGNSSVGTGTWYGIAAGAVSSASYFGKAATAPDANVFQGYISNLRVSSVARTAAIPTSGYANDANTVFLFNSSNQFVDKSSNGYAITVASSGTSVTPFSPFAPTQSYSAAAVGGSGYFDGNTDWLSLADSEAFNFGNGDFTIEMWTYLTGTSTANAYRMTGQCSSAVFDSDLSFSMLKEDTTDKYLSYVRSGSTNYETRSSQSATRNAWVHIALVRSGGNLNQYINGQLDGQSTALSTNTINNSTKQLSIGRQGELAAGYYEGNIANYRIVKGTAVYTGNFTPPTKPLAASGADSAGSYPSTTNVNTSFASSACSLLLNFTNAGVVDATAKNVLETVGNAQISNGAGGGKWGGGSIYLPQVSTTDYLKEPSTIIFSGDFVIEGWIYFSSSSTGFPSLFSGTTSSQLQLQFNSTGATYYFSFGGSTIINAQASGLSTDTWTHFAIVRSGTATNNISVYFGGTRKNQATSTATVTQALLIGVDGSAANPFKGYVDDLRITLGNTRGYSGASITVPSAPFPLQ